MEKTNRIEDGKTIPQAQPDKVDVKSNADAELRLDGEDDTLYNDGLDPDTNAGELSGTRGNTPGIAKP